MNLYDNKDTVAKKIEDDIWTIVGGHFTPDALSPEGYDEIKNRVLSQPEQYLDSFENLFLGMQYDPVDQSELYLANLLELLSKVEDEKLQVRITNTAEWLIHQYDAVLSIYDNVENFQVLLAVVPEEVALDAQRLDDRRIDLRMLLE